MKRIKYWLLCLLLNDVCRKSDCENCCFFHNMEFPWDECAIADVYHQARKVWDIEED